MKLIKYIICACVMVIGLASCSVTRYKAYSPTITQLNLQMDDMEYLGESEITVEYRKYLGIITVIDKINGQTYERKEIKQFPIFSNGSISDNLMSHLQMSSYKLLEDYPDADYFIVTNQKSERQQLFLGSTIKAEARVKAYLLR